MPTKDRRVRLSYARRLGVLLRTVLVEKEAMYRKGESVSTFAPDVFELGEDELRHVGDDSLGRALDRLFDADRGSLLTDIMMAAIDEFDIDVSELHNDSTSIKFYGRHKDAGAGLIRGKRAAAITYGYSKDHRPDLKQLIFILTTTEDGGVPVQFRCEAGNTNDVRTHEWTWDTLCKVTGRKDFLYVADSKLCNFTAMEHIDKNGGRLVTVMPRSRAEDKRFRELVQTEEVPWTLVRDGENARDPDGPRDRWWLWRQDTPSSEAWPIVWVFSEVSKLHRGKTRDSRIIRAKQELADLDGKQAGPRPRRRSWRKVRESVDEILERNKVRRYVKVDVVKHEEHRYKQAGKGRPGPATRYVRSTKVRWRLKWSVDEAMVDYDRNSDGMYPLLTNDNTLTELEVFEAHKRQPVIEKRFSQTKSVLEIAPVYLKNGGRVEAFFFIYFLALLVQALVERELRRAMKREQLTSLPLYPEGRGTKRPTAEQILRLFARTERHHLRLKGQKLRTFVPELTRLQLQILNLMKIPAAAYTHIPKGDASSR